ncbi:hypothetical protein [Bacillus sp. FJAT-18017]|uniref:hypothetical protein n=1 Tax=Bacillus sp. FJAT-18017 TaxID=1705566 RepID=UPI0006AE9302|nr:hypothetical protein [Bacillus sp. FJAT-18017]
MFYYPNNCSHGYYQSHGPSPVDFTYYNYPWHAPPQRQFPDVNISQLNVSLRKFQELMNQANILINKMATDSNFTKMLMTAAQKSDKNRVNQLIRSTGITIKAETTYTPTGIRIVLDNSGPEGGCCDLLIALGW